MIITETNPLCSVHLVPSDTIQKGIFTERHLMADSSTRGHKVKAYLQPVGLYDNLLLQVHSNAVLCRVFVINEMGQFVKQRTFTGPATVLGNTAPDYTGAAVQLKTFFGQIRFADLDLPEGLYRIAMELSGGTAMDAGASVYDPLYSEVRYLLSEPLWVRKYWPGSVLITYRNRINQNNFIWEQIGASTTAQFRIPAAITDSDLELDAQRYEEGSSDPILLSAITATIYQLQTPAIPLWARQKLNAIAGCSEVAYDSRRMVATAKPELGEGAYNKSVTLSLQTQHQAAEYVSGNNGAIDTGPYPYVVAGMRINTVYNALPTPVLVQSAADRSTAIDALNGRLSSFGLNGRFVQHGTGLAYVSDGIEALRQVEGVILNSFLETIATNYLSTVTTQATGNGYRLVVQPQKTEPAFALSPINSSPGTGTVSVTGTYTYGMVGPRPPAYTRVFYGPANTTLSITGSQATSLGTNSRSGLLSSFTGTFDALTSFDASALGGAIQTLTSLVLVAPSLVSVTGLNRGWRRLGTIDFRNAKLSSAAVDAIINDVAGYVNSTGIQNGVLKLQGQSPAAPPTAAASASRTLLQNNGWTVTTD